MLEMRFVRKDRSSKTGLSGVWSVVKFVAFGQLVLNQLLKKVTVTSFKKIRLLTVRKA